MLKKTALVPITIKARATRVSLALQRPHRTSSPCPTPYLMLPPPVSDTVTLRPHACSLHSNPCSTPRPGKFSGPRISCQVIEASRHSNRSVYPFNPFDPRHGYNLLFLMLAKSRLIRATDWRLRPDMLSSYSKVNAQRWRTAIPALKRASRTKGVRMLRTELMLRIAQSAGKSRCARSAFVN